MYQISDDPGSIFLTYRVGIQRDGAVRKDMKTDTERETDCTTIPSFYSTDLRNVTISR